MEIINNDLGQWPYYTLMITIWPLNHVDGSQEWMHLIGHCLSSSLDIMFLNIVFNVSQRSRSEKLVTSILWFRYCWDTGVLFLFIKSYVQKEWDGLHSHYTLIQTSDFGGQTYLGIVWYTVWIHCKLSSLCAKIHILNILDGLVLQDNLERNTDLLGRLNVLGNRKTEWNLNDLFHNIMLSATTFKHRM